MKAFQWTFCAVPIATTLGRLYIRYSQFRKLQADDVFNVLALLTLIGYTAVAAVNDAPGVSFILRKQLAGDMLLWTTLYLVKASFLSLIWCIFRISAGFRKAWWIVAIYTFLTFWVIFLSKFWQCGTPTTYDNPQACDYGRITQQQTREVFVAFALHISSDLLVTILPMVQIRKLNMPLGRKISVAAIFAIVIVDTMAGLARNIAVIIAALGSPTDASQGVSFICAIIEPALAVLVCSLPPYKALISNFRFRRHDDFQLQSTATGSESIVDAAATYRQHHGCSS